METAIGSPARSGRMRIYLRSQEDLEATLQRLKEEGRDVVLLGTHENGDNEYQARFPQGFKDSVLYEGSTEFVPEVINVRVINRDLIDYGSEMFSLACSFAGILSAADHYNQTKQQERKEIHPHKIEAVYQFLIMFTVVETKDWNTFLDLFKDMYDHENIYAGASFLSAFQRFCHTE